MPAVVAIESTGAGLATGTASSTRASRGGRRSRRREGPRGGVARWVPASPTISSTSSPRVTSVAAPVRSSSWTPWDWALVDRAGHAHQVAVEAHGPAGGVERTATGGRLDDHRAAGECRDQAVAAEEPTAGRRTARRHLGDHGRGAPQVLEQLVVSRRVGPVGAARENGDVRALDGQRATMGRLVDAERGAGHHGLPRSDQGAGDAGRDVGAVRRGRTRPHHGHGSTELVEAGRPLHPEAERGSSAVVEELGPHQVVDLGRPLVVSRHDVAEPQACCSLEVADRVDLLEPRRRVTRLGGRLSRVAEAARGDAPLRAGPPARRSWALRAR